MALGDQFKLAKLTISGYRDPKRSKLLGKPFVVQYNPESLSLRYQSVFGKHKGMGSSAQGGPWSHSPPQRLTVNLVVDGTGVGHMGVQLREVRTVAAQIDHFLAIAYNVHGDIHEPAYLKLEWGAGVLDPEGFPCRLESVDINYKSFDRDGAPLHADLAAVFVESLTTPKKDKKVKFSSPDLSHRRVVVEGDTLPLLCLEIYGSASHYLRVAQINRLDDFRHLVAGQELIFPPLERPRRR